MATDFETLVERLQEMDANGHFADPVIGTTSLVVVFDGDGWQLSVLPDGTWTFHDFRHETRGA